MSGISNSIEMDTRELKQNKACFSPVIPKGISLKRLGDLGHLGKEKAQENKIGYACNYLLSRCLNFIVSGHINFGVEMGVGVDSGVGNNCDDLGPNFMVK